MPKLRRNNWQAYHLDALPEAKEPAEVEDRRIVKQYVSQQGLEFSPIYVARQEQYIVRWVLLLGTRGKSLLTADDEDAAAMITEMRTWGMAPGTVRQVLRAWRRISEFVVDKGLAARNPFRGYKAPRVPKRLPRFLERTEITGMARAAQHPTVRDLRDRALLLFTYTSGCRTCGVQRLNIGDLNLSGGSATVFEKNSKERTVYFSPEAAEAIDLWLRIGRPVWAKACSKVFIGRNGGPINTTALRDCYVRLASRAGLRGHVHPHLLRHSFATHLVDDGATILEVRDLLGHADLASTQVYAHVRPQNLRRAHAKTFGAGADGADAAGPGSGGSGQRGSGGKARAGSQGAPAAPPGRKPAPWEPEARAELIQQAELRITELLGMTAGGLTRDQIHRGLPSRLRGCVLPVLTAWEATGRVRAGLEPSGGRPRTRYLLAGAAPERREVPEE